jgi:hypothetical protein
VGCAGVQDGGWGTAVQRIQRQSVEQCAEVRDCGMRQTRELILGEGGALVCEARRQASGRCQWGRGQTTTRHSAARTGSGSTQRAQHTLEACVRCLECHRLHGQKRR